MKSRFTVPLISTWAFLSLCVQLASALPDLEPYGRLPNVDKMAISPNGEYLAFRRTEQDQDIIAVYSMRQAKFIAGANISEIDPTYVFFHSNNILILGVSQHEKLRNYKHSMKLSTAFSYDIKKNRLEPLIRLGESLGSKKRVYPGQSGVGRIFGTSADRKYLYMPAYVAQSQLDQAPNYSLLRVNADGKGKPKVVSRGNYHMIDYFLDAQGEVLARESFNERSNIHKIQAKQGKKWVTIYEKSTELIIRSFVGVTPDFTQLVYLVNQRNSDRNAYFAMSLEDGKVERLPYARKDADIERVIHNQNRVVFGLQYSGFSPSYKFFEQEKQQQVDTILKTFDQHSVHLLDWSMDWQKILVKVEGSSYAGSFYSFPKTGKPQFITSAYHGIDNKDLNPIGSVNFKARDGKTIPTLITIPHNKLDDIKDLPAVVLPHGGPAAHDTIGFDFIAQALASRGILVIQPQFRGSTGFGYEHMHAGYGEWGKKMQDDISDAVAFFVRKGFINQQRVCIAGASYGGYAALAGAAFTPNTYRCAVSIAGVSHLPKMLSTDTSRYGKDSSVMAYFKQSIGGGEFDKQALREISPYYHAEKINIPVLLIHGADDIIVAYNQSQLMHAAIKKAKGNSKLVKLKKEDHHLQESETRLQALEEMVSFIVDHIVD
ncbi:MAG: prolyl oligopeptidase family serine peptidase [Cellvibrionaceae bacterium]|nr:prolyl oligopeptidase family serine peptidase [Cellvibrionaceae bacterium]